MKVANNFHNYVRQQFVEFIDDYGFRLDPERRSGSSAGVTLRSDEIYVTIRIGPPDFEPHMTFGPFANTGTSPPLQFEAGDLIQLDSCRNWEWQQSDSEPYNGLICEFVRLLVHCKIPFLKADDSVFDEMESKRLSSVNRWRNDEHVNAVRRDAVTAWRDRDFSAIVNLYQRIESELTDVERSRLSYATKKLESKGIK